LACARQARAALGCGTLGAAYAAALPVLIDFLGMPWMAKHITGSSSPTDFFKNNWDLDDNYTKHNLRVIQLAESLLNLQFVPGFRSVLTRLKTDKPEAIIAEFETARLLSFSGISFKFRVPVKKARNDYDLDIFFEDHKAAGEIKCKIETTDPDFESLFRALKDSATDQMPKDRPCLFFVKIPHSWINDQLVENLEKSVVAPLFRRHKRVVAIYFYSILAVDLTTHACPITLINHYLNSDHRFDRTVRWDSLFDRLSGVPEWWLDIGRIAADGRGAMIPSENGNVFISEG